MKTLMLKAIIVLFLGSFPYLGYAELMCVDAQGPKSGTSDDAPSVVSCPSGYTLTGCTCYSPWDSCDGAKPDSTNNVCTAYNKYKGAGVFAEATCCLIKSSAGSLNCVNAEGSKSGTSDDAPSAVSCPSSYTLTGCTCYSPWDSCDGAKPNSTNNVCTAYNKYKGAGVFAEAVCCNITAR